MRVTAGDPRATGPESAETKSCAPDTTHDCDGNPATRPEYSGHVRFERTDCSTPVPVPLLDDVEFSGLGNAGNLGEYPVHFHTYSYAYCMEESCGGAGDCQTCPASRVTGCTLDHNLGLVTPTTPCST